MSHMCGHHFQLSFTPQHPQASKQNSCSSSHFLSTHTHTQFLCIQCSCTTYCSISLVLHTVLKTTVRTGECWTVGVLGGWCQLGDVKNLLPDSTRPLWRENRSSQGCRYTVQSNRKWQRVSQDGVWTKTETRLSGLCELDQLCTGQ